MTHCHNNNFLQRDGTSQQQRLLKALLPEYVAVDERKIRDLQTFALNYAKEIIYYDAANSEAGNWEAFFNKEVDPEQRTEPHYALFLAFLQLFKIAQDDLNGITGKHLDFYYREVLQLEEKPALPDQVFIIFNLAKHVSQHLVQKGTLLKAGKDASGKELLYQTDKEIVVNTASVKELRSVYKGPDGRVYASPVANSADGSGAKIETDEMSWRTFGKPEGTAFNTDRPQAEIGFAFASPILFLAEGDREVTITLSLTGSLSVLKELDLRNSFRVRFSGEKEWIEPLMETNTVSGGSVPPAVEQRILAFLNNASTWEDIAGREPQHGPVMDNPTPGVGYGDQIGDYDIGKTTAEKILVKRDELGGFDSLDEVRSVDGVGQDKIDDLVYSFRNPLNETTIDLSTKQIIIKRTITKAQKAIVAYNEEALLDPFKTSWPVVKITLDTAADPYVYNQLSKFKIKQAEISVAVVEVRELVIQNDQSVLDASKVFQPFGLRPVIGSNFYIGSREVFSKRLDTLTVMLGWHGLPADTDGFEEYYREYIGDVRDNESFKANIYVLDKKSWVDLDTEALDESEQNLFSTKEGTEELISSHRIVIQNSDGLNEVERAVELLEFEALDTDSKKGFIKLTLTGRDFGHKDFQPSFTKQVLTAVKDSNPDVPMPNEPYTPEIKDIFVNYTSSVEVELSKSVSRESYVEQFFHVEAFGVAEQNTIRSGAQNLTIDLFPQYNHEGELFIGLDNFVPGQNISLLFQVAEGSADPDLEPQPLTWCYLADNKWVKIDQFDVLSDTTTGLLTSGIITFAISRTATNSNSAFTPGLHWLKASVTESSDAVSDLIMITAQAVAATFKDKENDPAHLRNALPQETISKLKVADSAIKKISQPFASFGGKMKEQNIPFYTRVSERLRHKYRAITIWDYEHLVLEEFPSSYKVKCLNHTRYTGSLTNYSELAPRHVTLVVISNVRNKNAVDPLRPKTSLITLVNIQSFISKLNSSCVELHVKNPIYEEIKIKTNVKFYAGYDNGFYAKKLEQDIKAFLSPWAFDGTTDLVLGGKIHKSVILNFVEELPYVDFLTCFEMYHIVRNPATGAIVSHEQVEEATASTAVSVLGSVGQKNSYGDHLINALETDACACDDNEILPTAAIASVDDCPCDENQLYQM